MIGFHSIFDFYDCDPRTLDSRPGLEAILREAAEVGGLTVKSSAFYDFQPGGISGTLLLAESHLCIHTWPEANYAAVDCFTCKKDTDMDAVQSVLTRRLGAGRCDRKDFRRGTDVRGASPQEI